MCYQLILISCGERAHILFVFQFFFEISSSSSRDLSIFFRFSFPCYIWHDSCLFLCIPNTKSKCKRKIWIEKKHNGKFILKKSIDLYVFKNLFKVCVIFCLLKSLNYIRQTFRACIHVYFYNHALLVLDHEGIQCKHVKCNVQHNCTKMYVCAIKICKLI